MKKYIINILSIKQMKLSKAKNYNAIVAIALTTILFTALFTIMLAINTSIQESNFRQAGGYAEGSFKYLTKEQFNEIKDDPLIDEYGLRRIVGMSEKAPFLKSHVEIGYSDEIQATWMYCVPIEGSLPTENSNEAATDTRVLELLGIEPVIGNSFTISFDVNGIEVTESLVSLDLGIWMSCLKIFLILNKM